MFRTLAFPYRAISRTSIWKRLIKRRLRIDGIAGLVKENLLLIRRSPDHRLSRSSSLAFPRSEQDPPWFATMLPLVLACGGRCDATHDPQFPALRECAGILSNGSRKP